MQDKPKSAGSKNLIPGATRRLGGHHRHGGARPGRLRSPSCSPAPRPSSAATPNSHVTLVDAAMPGMLPVINEECVAQAVRTGLGLKAQINLESVFDRKNYFYPDLPQGYQISQYKQPIVGEGEVGSTSTARR